MPREIITVSVGQCGNQIGESFWKRLTLEHGISAEGMLESYAKPHSDRKDIFFYQNDNMGYVPRAIMLDLEPRVVNGVLAGSHGRMFDTENVFLAENGGGAGNNWAAGFDAGQNLLDDVMEIFDRNAEGCDMLDGFNMLHAIAGGTGSGLGSALLERLNDDYAKKLITTYSVFPGSSESDVVVEPYNSILTLKRLALYADAVTVLDNEMLLQMAAKTLGLKSPTHEHANSLVASVMSAATATMRFPSYFYNDMTSILASLVSYPECHFITAAYTPFVSPTPSMLAPMRRSSMLDVLRRLMQPQTRVLSPAFSSASGRYLSALAIVQGEETKPLEAHHALMRVRQANNYLFSDRVPAAIQMAVTRPSPYIHDAPALAHTPKLTGLALSNHTNVALLLERVVKQYSLLSRRGAFLEPYKRYSLFQDDLSEFQHAQEVIEGIIAAYRQFELPAVDESQDLA